MSVHLMNYHGNLIIGPRMVRNGLVVHLDPRNPKSYPGTGDIVTDISPEGIQRNAQFYNGYNISSEGIYFDGINGRGIFGQPSITYNDGAGQVQQFSIGFFIKPDLDSGWLVSPSSFGADHFIRNSTGSGGVGLIQVTQSTDVGNRSYSSTAGSVPANNLWTYILFTLNDVEIEIYINGKLNASITNPLPVANWTGSWAMANRAFGLGQYFRGWMDNFHVFNRAINPTEVKQIFDSFKGRYSNLITKN